MIVVLAIIAIVTVIAVVGQSQFNNSLLLTDTAYTVALSVRQAQSLGISSRTFSTISNTGYGVHFSNVTSGPNRTYFIFADTNPVSPGSTLSGKCPGHTGTSGNPDAKPGNCLYDSSVLMGTDGMVQSFTFSRGFTFGKICGHTDSTHTKCLGTDFSDGIDVSFLRPNTQTVIIGSSGSSYTELTDLCVHIASPNFANSNANIFISQAGQVSVLATCPGTGWPSWP